MRCSRFITYALCIILALSVCLCSSAQVQPSGESQTWNTLAVLQKHVLAIHALALDAAIHPTGRRNQLLYRKHLEEIERLCATIEYGDIFARTTVRDRLNIAEIAFRGRVGDNHLVSINVDFEVTQPATTAKLIIVVPTFIPRSGKIWLGSSVITLVGSSRPNYSLHIALENLGEEQELLSEYDLQTNTVTFTHLTPGSQFNIRLEDPNRLLSDTPVREVSGTDALAQASVWTFGSQELELKELLLRGGTKPGDNGLVLRDRDDNRITLTYAGNRKSESHLIATLQNICLIPLLLGNTTVPGANLTMIDLTTPYESKKGIMITNEATAQLVATAALFLQKHPNFHP